ncbi:TPA: hypothetical protein JIP90_003504 [Acinetobacter baumannii]|uniref:hypothetical protein n=1 Tax=Acinetobacter baumannii TaxID=470 RepID=UPI0020235814|nr:hypothetical protein [Acinetobacter baumannii]MCL8260978.1 hypothetical protein [Acinetobacter baumannii]HAV4196725.1 hypothetical protein [Acinetobacter baumannii]HAV5548409.1 hypothetical protein [Acinetobacter baumannii]
MLKIIIASLASFCVGYLISLLHIEYRALTKGRFKIFGSSYRAFISRDIRDGAKGVPDVIEEAHSKR